MSQSLPPAAAWDPKYGQPPTPALHRASYPSFLSLPATLKLHMSFLARGLLDSFRWDITIKTVYLDPTIRSHVLKSLVLNGLSFTSIYVFDYVLLPLATRGRVHRNASWLYRVLWLVPLAGTSLYLNASWAGVVAKRSHVLRHGTRSTVPPQSYGGMLMAMATSAYRVVMIVTSIVLTSTLSYVPIIGPSAAFAFLCWVNAYYCFEFTWIARGLSLAQRVRHLEERWAYYFSFGLPSAMLCAFFPGLAGAVLFALLLPLYIIKATNANPVPKYPYSPIASGQEANGHTPHAYTYPSPFVPIRIPVFALVIAIDNFIVSVLSVGTPSGSRVRTALKEGTEKQGLPGDAEVAADAEEGVVRRKRRLNKKHA